MKRKQLLSEAQIKRMAQIAGIPAMGIVSEKVNIQAEETETEETTTNEETTEETVEEATDVTEGGDYMETDEDPTDAASMEAEEEAPAAEGEVPQEKIESLVDAVLAAIEAETGVPASRVEDDAPAEEEPEAEAEVDADAELEADAEAPADDAEEMLETELTLAEKIAAAVQTVIDEDAALEESTDETETTATTTTTEDEKLEEITKAVVARLRTLKK